MKNMVQIWRSSANTYVVTVWSKKSHKLYEYGHENIEIVLAIAQEMNLIYKIGNLIIELDVFELVVEELKEAKVCKRS